MAIWLDKPWEPLTAEAIAALPAQLGVYEVADEAGNVVSIGYGGGREIFGIRSALERELAVARPPSFASSSTMGT